MYVALASALCLLIAYPVAYFAARVARRRRALLLAAGLMLDHVGRQDLAARLRAGVEGTLRADGIRTRDLGGQATTAEFAQAVIRRIGRVGAG